MRLEELGFQWVVNRGGWRSGRRVEEPEDEEMVERDESRNGSEEVDDESCPTASIGEVGYVFRKQFDDGWYYGEVVKIRSGTAKGKDRQCRYTDGDEEDLSMRELQTLAKLDKMAEKKTRGRGAKSNGSTKPDFRNSPKVVSAGRLSGTKTPRQLLCPKVCDKALHDRRDHG